MNEPTQVLRVPLQVPGISSGQPPSKRVGSRPEPPAVAEQTDGTPTVASETPPAIAHPAARTVVFPGFEILTELGRGGMGVVYKARQKSLNRLVALKVILGGPHASDEDRARFRVEAEAGARLHHPNIVEVYDVGEAAGFSYIALELLEGGTLRRWQDGRPVEARLAARIASDIARAVQHAHENGIIHRDLKPANILIGGGTAGTSLAGHSGPRTAVTEPGARAVKTTRTQAQRLPAAFVPKVGDFGLAKAIDGGGDLTITGTACGTPNYMAPEQVRGARHVGPAVDVYGLGAVLFELLTGHAPFTGSDAAEVMNRILRSEAPSVRKFVPAVPRDLAVIVAKCLEKDPARRYLTVCAVADDLDRFLAHLAILARPVGTIEAAWRWVRRNPVVTGFLVLTTLGFGVTTGLTAALARSESVERSARAEATEARTAAEQTRDQLKAALVTAEEEKLAAEAARRVADQEKARAVEQKTAAEQQRQLAQENLRISREVIRTTLTEFSRDRRFEGPEFQDYRTKLIAAARRFRDEVAARGGDAVEWLDDLADVSHWLGYLEFLNDNQFKAAAEYQTAAVAAKRWSELQPRNPEPRWKRADSLVNAGNALSNSRHTREAEAAYREAIAEIEKVLADHTGEHYLRSAFDAHTQLAKALRFSGPPEQELAAARAALGHARCLARRETPTNLATLAAAHAELASAFARSSRSDDAEAHLVESLAVHEQIRARPGSGTRAIADTAAAMLTLASHRASRGKLAEATTGFTEALQLLEQAVTDYPNTPGLNVALADGYTRHGDHYRRLKKLEDAEKRYEQALAILDEQLRFLPKSGEVRAAWARAMTGRNHLLNQLNRHREAAGGWAKLATRDPDSDGRWRAELFVLQSLLFASDWKAAALGAEPLLSRNLPLWMCYDLARVYCLISRAADDDPNLEPAERLAAVEKATGKAVALLQRGRADGLFNDPKFIRLVETLPEFAPIRDKFDPRK